MRQAVPDSTRNAPAGHVEAAPADNPAPDQPEPQQARFEGFYAVVSGYDGMPPDRAIYREAVAAAFRDGPDSFNHCGYVVAIDTVLHAALAFFMRTDRAGIYNPTRRNGKRPMSLQAVLAQDTRKSARAMKAALWVLSVVKLTRHDRPKARNRPARWSLNIGGLDWPMVRARIQALRNQPPVVSPTTPRGASRGVVGDTTDLRATYVGHDQQQQQPPLLDLAKPEPAAAEPEPAVDATALLPPVPQIHARRPTPAQLRGILDMGDELRAAGIEPYGPDRPVTRSQASEVFRVRRFEQIPVARDPERRRALRRAGATRAGAAAIRRSFERHSAVETDFTREDS